MNDDTPPTRAVLKAVLKEELATTETRIREYIDERTRDLQTELLRAFSDYNASAAIRFRKLEAD